MIAVEIGYEGWLADGIDAVACEGGGQRSDMMRCGSGMADEWIRSDVKTRRNRIVIRGCCDGVQYKLALQEVSNSSYYIFTCISCALF